MITHYGRGVGKSTKDNNIGTSGARIVDWPVDTQASCLPTSPSIVLQVVRSIVEPDAEPTRFAADRGFADPRPQRAAQIVFGNQVRSPFKFGQICGTRIVDACCSLTTERPVNGRIRAGDRA